MNELLILLGIIAGAAHLVLAIFLSSQILQWAPYTRTKIALWLMVIWLLPLLGPAAAHSALMLPSTRAEEFGKGDGSALVGSDGSCGGGGGCD